MENTTNSPETTGAEQTKSLDSLLDQAVDGETIKGGLHVSFGSKEQTEKGANGNSGGSAGGGPGGG